MNIVAIDCGASFIKAAKFLNDTDEMIEKKLYATECQTEEVFDEQDVNLPPQLKRTISAVKKSILELTTEGEKVAVGICNEMHGFVLADSCMQPYMDYVSWKKEYIMEPYDGMMTWKDYLSSNLETEDIKKTGMPFKAGLASGNAAYIIRKQVQTQKEMFFYTLGDFIITRIAEKNISCHPSNAAAAGLYDIEKQEWNDRLIHDLGLGGIKFPQVSECKECITCNWKGRVCVFFSAIGDQQAALLGAGLREKGQLSVNMGTGGQVSILTDEVLLSDKFQTRPYFENSYLLSVPHIPSGRAMNVYFNFVKDIASGLGSCMTDEEIWSWIINEAEIADNQDVNSLDVDMSFFSNAVTPHTSGAIENIDENRFKVGTLFAAIYRKMAENVFYCAERICFDITDIHEIIFSGGISAKHKLFRKNVLQYFPGVKYQIASDETLKGIVKYVLD
jgi:sugar (pentulose or hexulose) kinase